LEEAGPRRAEVLEKSSKRSGEMQEGSFEEKKGCRKKKTKGEGVTIPHKKEKRLKT